MERDASRRGRRKLLVASVGVATVSYAMLGTACEDNTRVSGNLIAPPPRVSTTPPVTGNLPAPPPTVEVTDAAGPLPDTPAISGNLVAPVPRDAGSTRGPKK